LERKCIICGEKHDKHFHNPEFATENIDNDERCSKGLKTKETDFVKITLKDRIQKKDPTGKPCLLSYYLAFCLTV
jgi:hypothetical protein